MSDDRRPAPRRGFEEPDIDSSASPAQASSHRLSARQVAQQCHHGIAQGSDVAAAAGWTVASTVLPGTGLWPTRHRTLGLVVACLLLAVGIAVGVVTAIDPRFVRSLLVNPTVLNALSIGLIVVGIAWVVNIVATHLQVRPAGQTVGQRVGSSVLVTVLSMAISVPTFVGASYVNDSSALVREIFATNKRSQTRPTINPNTKDAWAGKPRLNVLLLGSDGNRVRDQRGNGIRTDTMILASIDTQSGNTVLIQLPRNMARAQFPPGTQLAERYPDGFYNGNGDDLEFMLNAVYNNVPAENPDLFQDTDYPGADALKLAVGGTTGLMPDYFVMVNIDGIQKLIDAMGGVTVNINERLGIGGNDVEPPTGYLEPGPNQHLDGYHAMWYARSRHTSEGGDFSRMSRQTCLIQAIVDQADPGTLLTKYEAIAESAKNILLTDIPQNMLSPIVELALRVKDARINRVLFIQGQDGFTTYDPDFNLMRRRIDLAIQRNTAKASTSARASSTQAAKAPATSLSANPASTRTATGVPANGQAPQATRTAGAAQSDPATPFAQPSVDIEPVKDACAYNPIISTSAQPGR